MIGEAAATIARSNYKSTVTNIKRLIGRKWHEPELQKEVARLPFTVVKVGEDDVGVEVSYNDESVVLRIEQVLAMLLVKCQDIVLKSQGGNVILADSVVGIPAWYTDTHRRSFKSACQIAGLNCLRLMHEPTAVALSYGIYKNARNEFHESEAKRVMFIDMGHSQFSATVVSFIKGSLTVQSCVCDANLGSRNVDDALANHLADQFQAKHKLDARTNKKSYLKLLQSSERAKKNLSPLGMNECLVTVECLMEDLDFTYTLTLEAFEGLCAPFCARVAAPISKALAESSTTADQLDAVEIVGGGTRMPCFKRAVAEALSLDMSANNFGLSTTMNADECVANGCALQAAILSSRFKVKDFAIKEAVAYPIRLTYDQPPAAAGAASADMDTGGDDDDAEATAAGGPGGDNSMVIFQRNEESPKVRRVTFKRDAPFEVALTYDSSAVEMLPEGCSLEVATFRVTGMPTQTDAKGGAEGEDPPKVRVNFKHDMNGIVSVSSAQMMLEEVVEQEKEGGKNGSPEKKEDEKKEGGGGEKTDENKGDSAKEAAAAPDHDAKEPATPPPPAGSKKKFRKHELKVEMLTSTGLTPDQLNQALETEAQMALQDKVIRETTEKRNDLETYIYQMRDQIIDRLAPFLSMDAKEEFKKQLEEAEEWLYSDEGFDTVKSAYVTKLGDLKGMGDPCVRREYEHLNREKAQKELSQRVEEYKALANTTDDAFAHITESERAKVKDECKATLDWLYEALDKQKDKELYEDPVLTTGDIYTKNQVLYNVCNPILSRPKPAPAPAPAPAPDAPAPDAEKKNEESENKMDEGDDKASKEEGDSAPMEAEPTDAKA